ncbi:hypothetical protein MKW98_025386, partial [Papaver atlanticum]
MRITLLMLLYQTVDAPIDEGWSYDLIDTTFFSPLTAAPLVVTLLDHTVDARRYVEVRRLG